MVVNIHAENPNRATGRARDAVYHAQGRCLARAVGPQKTEARLRWDLEVQIIHSHALAESFRNRSCADDGRTGKCLIRNQTNYLFSLKDL
jgi:hypothetical protein